jgi:AraC-like DNA-binding protein
MFVSMLIVRAVMAELSRKDIATHPLLEPLGLSEEKLASLSDSVGIRDFARLVRAAQDVTGDTGLGLTLGARAPECALHAVSHVLLAAASLREACGAVCRYVPNLAPALSFQLREQGELAHFGYTTPKPDSNLARFGAEFALSLGLTLAQRISSEPIALQEVWLMYPAPAHAERYTQLFGCPVYFERPLNALGLPRAALDKRRPYVDATLAHVLGGVAEQLLVQPKRHDTLGTRVQEALRYEPDLAHVDFDRIASRWGMTRRTLRRRLKSEGKVLADLLDEARFHQAGKELQRPHESIKEIAERLGYAEPSSFHRAFKRWSGVGPAEYRRRVLRDARRRPHEVAPVSVAS